MREGQRPEEWCETTGKGRENLELVDLTHTRPPRGMTLPRLLSILLACLAVKGGVVTVMGPAAYGSFLAQLDAGNILSRFVALLLSVDMVTLGFADFWGRLRV